MDDVYYMKEALLEAAKASCLDEVPIGCVIVYKGKIISRAKNERVTQKNVLCHAEILAIDAACKYLGDWRLEDTRLYVTVEPCPMCAGAIVQARIPYVIFGAKSPKAGAAGSIINLLNVPGFNHQVQVTEGVLEEESSNLVRNYFKKFRNRLEKNCQQVHNRQYEGREEL